MKSYLDLYKQDPEHLTCWAKDILYHIKQFKSVAVIGIPKVGVARVLDYVAYKLSNTTSFNTIYSSSITEKLEHLLQEVKPGCRNVLIVQKFPLRSDSFRKGFCEFIQTNKTDAISLISLDADIHKKTSEVVFDQTAVMNKVVYIKPLPYMQMVSFVKSREFLDGNFLSENKYKEIYSSVGGHGGLTKHMINFSKDVKILDSDEIRNYPPIRSICEQIYAECAELSEDILAKIGLIDNNGCFSIAILEKKKMAGSYAPPSNLSKQHMELFNMLIENEGKVLKREVIEGVLTATDNYSLWGFYKSISRFRKEIAPNFELVNSYGNGYSIRRIIR